MSDAEADVSDDESFAAAYSAVARTAVVAAAKPKPGKAAAAAATAVAAAKNPPYRAHAPPIFPSREPNRPVRFDLAGVKAPPGGDVNSIEDLAARGGGGGGGGGGALVWPYESKWTASLPQYTGLLAELCSVIVSYCGARGVSRATFGTYFTSKGWDEHHGAAAPVKGATAAEPKRSQDDMRGDPDTTSVFLVPPNLSNDATHKARRDRFFAHCQQHWTDGLECVTYFQNGVHGNGAGVNYAGAGGAGSIVDDWMMEGRFALPPYTRDDVGTDRADVCPGYGYVYARYWVEETYDGHWIYFARARADLLRYACPPVVRDAIKKWDPIGFALDYGDGSAFAALMKGDGAATSGPSDADRAARKVAKKQRKKRTPK